MSKKIHRLYFNSCNGIAKVGITNHEPPLSLCDVEPPIKLFVHMIVGREVETFGKIVKLFIVHCLSRECPYWPQFQHYQPADQRLRFVKWSCGEDSGDTISPILHPGKYIFEFHFPLVVPSVIGGDSVLVEDYPTFTTYFDDRFYDQCAFDPEIFKVTKESYVEIVEN